MVTNGSILKTVAGKFKRLKYFYGMLLTENDFRDEQTYFRGKIKLNNRLHGQGVVWGLGLKPVLEEDPEGTLTPTSSVLIEAGFALDCEGNEILVCRDYPVDLHDHIDRLLKEGKVDCASPPQMPVKLYIGVKYCECESEPVQQYAVSCDDGQTHPEFSRIREGFCVEILRKEELPECACRPLRQTSNDCCKPVPECPGARHCPGECHIVILGSIEVCGPEIEAFRISENEIDMWDRRKFVYPLIESHRVWEKSRQSLLRALYREDQRIDISAVIGLGFESASRLLEKTGHHGEVMELPMEELLQHNFPDLIRNAAPYAREESFIELVTDQEGCVVLAFADRTAKGG